MGTSVPFPARPTMEAHQAPGIVSSGGKRAATPSGVSSLHGGGGVGRVRLVGRAPEEVHERHGPVAEPVRLVEHVPRQSRPPMRRRDGHQRGDARRPAHLARQPAGVQPARGEPDEVDLLGAGLLHHRLQVRRPRRGPDRDGVVRVRVRRIRPDAALAQEHRLVVEHAALHQVRQRAEAVQEHHGVASGPERGLGRGHELDGPAGDGFGPPSEAGEHGPRTPPASGGFARGSSARWRGCRPAGTSV